MKCVLVIPAWRPEDLFPQKTAGSQVNYWQPLGTLYVAAALREAGHEVRFLNGAFMTHRQILEEIRAFAPRFAGLYATAFGWSRAVTTASAIKELDGRIVTCVGGPYPTAVKERCLGEDARCLDAVVFGEGERTVVELAARLEAGDSLDGVSGTAFRKGRAIVCNPPRPLAEDLDALPLPARDLLGDASRYIPAPATYKRQPVAVMITSRGCNRRCIFCSQFDRDRKAGTRGVRMRSVEGVLAEIEACLKQGYREIKFLDDSFAADYGRALRIAREIKARGLDFTWFASACVNQVDKPLLRAMKEAGCWAILLGAESGVQRHLNTLRKGITLEQTRRAVRTAKEVGIKVSTPFLFGLPGETYEDGLKTIEFAVELAPDLANFHALTPFPGTYLYDNIERYGTLTGDLEDLTYQGAAFVPHTMTRDEILELRRLAFRRFYSRPSFLFRRLIQLRSWADCRAAFAGLRSLLALWTDRGLLQRRPRLRGRPASVRDTTAAGSA